jgi:hypothetical protein
MQGDPQEPRKAIRRGNICDARAAIWNHSASAPAQSDTEPNSRKPRVVTHVLRLGIVS